MCVCRLRFQNVAVHFINGVSALTEFYFKKMYQWAFRRNKNCGRKNKVIVLVD